MKTNQDRKTLLFAAGGVTGLIAVTVLALGIGFNNPASAESPAADAPAATVAAPISTPAVTADANDQLSQVLDQNAQLRQALTLMQEREAIYRQQLEQAAQSLQAAPAQPAAAWNDEDDDHNEGEDHDEDHDDHEYREHADREHDDD